MNSVDGKRRVHLAFDKFRGSLTQKEINSVLKGILPSTVDIHEYVIADGGEGSLDALFALGWTPIEVVAADTLGSTKKARVAQQVDQPIYAIELAEICGVKWLTRGPNPLHSTTLGIGQTLEALRKRGAREILLFSGGSASNDGGLGVLQGLGIRVLDKKNRIVKFGLAGLKHAASINGDDVTRVRDLYSTITFTMVHDTHATLTGKENCINLFAEQKGLGKLGRYFAERTLRKWAALLQGINPSFDPHKAGTGAAGGVTSPFSALFSTQFTNGFDFFSHETGLANSILPSDLLFTGEGRFDRTSRDKKIVMPTIQLAEKHGAECAVIVGSIAESERDFLAQQRAVKKVCVIADHATTADESISRASEIIVQSFSDQIKELV